ncbi:MAG: TatD family hydrolase [Candidatus Magasanikbacteria bacterium]|nr:TatD family hydrolase [Candidatus Magasanikbacteria bacterium]
MLFDTHAHAHFNAYQADSDEVIKRSLSKNVVINLVGTQSDTSKRAVEVAERFKNVFASVGLHPEHLFSKFVDEEETSFLSREEEFNFEYYKKLCASEKVIGIGECGLDFYRIPEGLSKEQMLPKQRQVFLEHIRLAKETNLPMVIHCREAHEELIEILQDATRDLPLPPPLQRRGDDDSPPLRKGEGEGGVSPLTGTIHCYTSNWENAQKYLAMGFYIGFTGVITFPPLKKNPQAQADLLEVVAKMPLERILLETDCPYLSPVPHRGKRGEPWMVEFTARKIAEIRGVSYDEVVKATTQNALYLFNKIKLND